MTDVEGEIERKHEGTPLLNDVEDGGGGLSSETAPKAKKKKSEMMPNDIKTNLQLERTFFKWIWTGFHLGAIGTFILSFFSSSRITTTKIILILFAWVLALSFVVYGLVSYYRRRAALRTNQLERRKWDNPYGPFIVCAAVSVEIIAVVVCCWLDE